MDFAPHVARILARLGETAVFTTTGGTVTASAVFTAHPEAGPDAEVYGPLLICMADDVTAVADGDAVHVAGEDYVIADSRPDPRGSGALEMVLTRA